MEATHSLSYEEISSQQKLGTRVSVEWIAYTSLLLLAVVLRFAQVDVVPMTQTEAREALAAWRTVYPQAPGGPIPSESPILFLIHSLTFTTLGATEFTARVGTLIGSLGLILTPLLFREKLGRGRSFVLSLLLVFSPVLLIASRMDSAMIWTALSGVLAIWSIWRYYETGQAKFAIFASSMVISTALLTNYSGFVFVLILIGGGLYALWTLPRISVDESIELTADPLVMVRQRLGRWPWLNSLLLSALLVFMVGTWFMFNPAGLSTVGNLLGAGLRGFTGAIPGAPSFFPLSVTLFYEPVLVFFTIVSIVRLIQQDTFTFVERFLLGWLIFGVIGSLIYASAGADQALWLVLPMAGLTSSLAVELLKRVEHPLWWGVPTWSKWVIAICGIFMLAMFAIHAQALGRALLAMPEGTFQFTSINSASIVLVIISLMAMVIGFFLAASLWGMTITVQGAAFALLAFGLVTSLSSGWRASVVTAENPVEFWNRDATSSDTLLLRDTLNEISRRESGGYPHIPIVALAPEDGVVAWLLRDYVNARFITNLSEAQAQEIALLPVYNEPPSLGGNYVGQTFQISRTWNPATVQLSDLFSWWIARRTRTPGVATNTIVLWLRQDVYDGVLDGDG